MYNLALCFADNDGVVEDETLAFEWFKRAAENGHVGAMNNVGLILSDQGDDELETVGFEWVKQAAEKGHVGAMYNLGTFYVEGVGVEKSNAEAFKWFKRAAK